MPIDIIQLDIDHPQQENITFYYEFTNKSKNRNFQSIDDFIRYKRQEKVLEVRWDFIVKRNNFPIGILTIKNTYQQPEPIYFLHIDLREKGFSNDVKLAVKGFLEEQKNTHGFQQFIAYESRPFMERFYHEMGGRAVNWLHFFELHVADVGPELLNAWADKTLLKALDLKLVYYDSIPEKLMCQHAALHTELSNDIQRMDYSWTVVKTASYTKNRQQLLALQGKKMEIGYLMDKDENLIGMTKVVSNPQDSSKVFQTITGIIKKYRGKGLAKLLKASMIMRIMQHKGEIKTIETDCLVGNDPMLFINESLGFRRKRGLVEKEIII